jgi:hypothetical protein
LRADQRSAGWWPLLIDDGTPEYFAVRAGGDRVPIESLDGAAILAARMAARPPSSREQAEQWVIDQQNNPEVPDDIEMRSGWDWPDDPVRHTLESRHSPSLGAADFDVTVVLVPVADGWRVHEALDYGWWNEYPRPDEHGAILRYWNQRWGADLFALTGTTAQFSVSRPPATRADAIALAAEWSAYNDGEYDYYGAHGPMELAASLLDAPAWFAWWD